MSPNDPFEALVTEAVSETAPVETEVLQTEQQDTEPVLLEQTSTTEEVPDYKALYEQRDKEFQEFQESIRPIQEYQRAQEQARLEELEQGLLSELFGGAQEEQMEISGGTPKLDANQRDAVQQLIRGGIQYYQQRETIQRNMLAGEAISYAEQVLGPTATISQLKEVARELASLQDSKLMEKAVPILKSKYRTEASTRRLETGADTVAASNPQAGIINDFYALEKAWVEDKIEPGSALEKRYFDMRAARGL